MTLRIPTSADVLDAQIRLEGVAVQTPVLRSDELDRLLGVRLFIKADNLQHSGAFKFRGAYNCLSRIRQREYPGGVVAYSTGNHGQAIATVARMLGMAATIVMPSDAPRVKMAQAARQGAQIVTYDRRTEKREVIAEQQARELKAYVVPPGDHPDVIAGQGTTALEALRTLRGMDLSRIVVPCGGGGLAAGTCLAVEACDSKAEVWAAEPEAFDDTRRSLAAGARVTNPQLSGSICDALLAPTPAELPFEINRRRLRGALTASDTRVLEAMYLLFREFRIVAEPGGAVGLAALLDIRQLVPGETVLAVVSGGNVDADVFKRALEAEHEVEPNVQSKR